MSWEAPTASFADHTRHLVGRWVAIEGQAPSRVVAYDPATRLHRIERGASPPAEVEVALDGPCADGSVLAWRVLVAAPAAAAAAVDGDETASGSDSDSDSDSDAIRARPPSPPWVPPTAAAEPPMAPPLPPPAAPAPAPALLLPLPDFDDALLDPALFDELLLTMSDNDADDDAAAAAAATAAAAAAPVRHPEKTPRGRPDRYLPPPSCAVPPALLLPLPDSAAPLSDPPPFAATSVRYRTERVLGVQATLDWTVADADSAAGRADRGEPPPPGRKRPFPFPRETRGRRVQPTDAPAGAVDMEVEMPWRTAAFAGRRTGVARCRVVRGGAPAASTEPLTRWAYAATVAPAAGAPRPPKPPKARAAPAGSTGPSFVAAQVPEAAAAHTAAQLETKSEQRVLERLVEYFADAGMSKEAAHNALAGWSVQYHTRQTGTQAGDVYWTYLEPDTQPKKRHRSAKSVLKHLFPNLDPPTSRAGKRWGGTVDPTFAALRRGADAGDDPAAAAAGGAGPAAAAAAAAAAPSGPGARRQRALNKVAEFRYFQNVHPIPIAVWRLREQEAEARMAATRRSLVAVMACSPAATLKAAEYALRRGGGEIQRATEMAAAAMASAGGGGGGGGGGEANSSNVSLAAAAAEAGCIDLNNCAELCRRAAGAMAPGAPELTQCDTLERQALHNMSSALLRAADWRSVVSGNARRCAVLRAVALQYAQKLAETSMPLAQRASLMVSCLEANGRADEAGELRVEHATAIEEAAAQAKLAEAAATERAAAAATTAASAVHNALQHSHTAVAQSQASAAVVEIKRDLRKMYKAPNPGASSASASAGASEPAGGAAAAADAAQLCKCGSSTHRRTSHRHCPLNRGSAAAAAATAAAADDEAIGGAAAPAETSSASGGGSAAAPQATPPLPSDALVARARAELEAMCAKGLGQMKGALEKEVKKRVRRMTQLQRVKRREKALERARRFAGHKALHGALWQEASAEVLGAAEREADATIASLCEAVEVVVTAKKKTKATKKSTQSSSFMLAYDCGNDAVAKAQAVLACGADAAALEAAVAAAVNAAARAAAAATQAAAQVEGELVDTARQLATNSATYAAMCATEAQGLAGAPDAAEVVGRSVAQCARKAGLLAAALVDGGMAQLQAAEVRRQVAAQFEGAG